MLTEEQIKHNLGRGKDLRGEKFNKLTPLFPLEKRIKKFIVWHCKCDCGQECDVIGSHLISGHTKSCGCIAIEHIQKQGQKKFIDLTGQIFGRLAVIKRVEDYITSNNNHYIQYLCQCNCENHTLIKVIGSNLKNGNTSSCGCIGQSKGEYIIGKILSDNNIFYEKQKIFKECKFLDTQYYARFDFWVENKYIIEFDGEQHFSYKNNENSWNNKKNFEETKKRDDFKNQWCKEHNIPLIRIPYTHLNNLCLNDLILETSKFIIL